MVNDIRDKMKLCELKSVFIILQTLARENEI